MMQVPIYTLHMLTFPDPECFRPERWTSKGEVIGSQRTRIHAQVSSSYTIQHNTACEC